MHEAHRTPLLRPPVPKRREVVARVTGEHAAIIPFDDLDRPLAGSQVHEQTAERILLRKKNST
jgi:hypothetical protein